MEILKNTNNFAQIAGNARSKSQEVTHKMAAQIAERARALAPVDTGALRDSIQSEGDTVIVGAPYGMFVEFGTTTQPAHPFLTPAIVATEREFGQALADAMIEGNEV